MHILLIEKYRGIHIKFLKDEKQEKVKYKNIKYKNVRNRPGSVCE